VTKRPETLLIVDDDDDNRELMSRRLANEGWATRQADGGQRALEALRAGGVDLVLLDLAMPDMDGLQVLKALRSTRSAAELPVIMVTASSDSEDVVEALGLGANDYVTKPIDFPVAVARIEAALRTRREASPLSPASLAEVGIGTVLGGRYRLETRIGTGNHGAVYRARHLELDRAVAVKVLRTGALGTGDALDRFRREGMAACRVSHPHAVAVLDFAVAGGVAYLVMELLEGHSLDAELAPGTPLGVQHTVSITVPVCEALAEAHRAGIVHRDVKPANIFLHRAGNRTVPKVLDFGIARVLGEDAPRRHPTLEGWIVGTPAYMAPERFESGACDGKADVYGVGVTLFQMLAGRLPFEAVDGEPLALARKHLIELPPPLRSLNPDVPLSLEETVMRALAKRPPKRPSAVELAALLAASAPPAG
jgi:eukaryotic-like serine/threonine-protein kinase